MAVEDYNKYMQLAKVLNNTWGTGSQLRSVSQSIKFNLRDERLMKVFFQMIVNIPNNVRTAHEFKQRYKNEALGKIKSALEDLKKRFEEQNGEKSIRFKLLDNSVTDSLEYLTNAQYRMNLHAFFRLDCLVRIE